MSRRDRNLEIAQRLWDAAAKGIPDEELSFHPDMVWRSFGQNPIAGTYYGVDEMLHYLAAVGEGVEEMRSDVLDILASDDGAAILYRVEAHRGPKKLDGLFLLWLRIEDDLVLEASAVAFDQAANDAFWRLE